MSALLYARAAFLRMERQLSPMELWPRQKEWCLFGGFYPQEETFFTLRFLFLVLSLFTRFVLVVQKVCRLSVPFPAPSVDTAWTLISRFR